MVVERMLFPLLTSLLFLFFVFRNEFERRVIIRINGIFKDLCRRYIELIPDWNENQNQILLMGNNHRYSKIFLSKEVYGSLIQVKMFRIVIRYFVIRSILLTSFHSFPSIFSPSLKNNLFGRQPILLLYHPRYQFLFFLCRGRRRVHTSFRERSCSINRRFLHSSSGQLTSMSQLADASCRIVYAIRVLAPRHAAPSVHTRRAYTHQAEAKEGECLDNEFEMRRTG